LLQHLCVRHKEATVAPAAMEDNDRERCLCNRVMIQMNGCAAPGPPGFHGPVAMTHGKAGRHEGQVVSPVSGLLVTGSIHGDPSIGESPQPTTWVLDIGQACTLTEPNRPHQALHIMQGIQPTGHSPHASEPSLCLYPVGRSGHAAARLRADDGTQYHRAAPDRRQDLCGYRSVQWLWA